MNEMDKIRRQLMHKRRILEGEIARLDAAITALSSEKVKKAPTTRAPRTTRKVAVTVLKVLEGATRGRKIASICNQVLKRYPRVRKGSIHSALSRLRASGKVELNGRGRWRRTSE